MKKLWLSGSLALLLLGALHVLADMGSPNIIVARNHGPRTDSTLNSIVTNLTGSAQIVVDSGIWTVSNNVTFTSGIYVHVMPGSYFSINSGKTVTVERVILAGDYTVFSGSGIGTLGSSYSGPIYGAWWANSQSNDYDACDIMLDGTSINTKPGFAYTMTTVVAAESYNTDSYVVFTNYVSEEVADSNFATNSGVYTVADAGNWMLAGRAIITNSFASAVDVALAAVMVSGSTTNTVIVDQDVIAAGKSRTFQGTRYVTLAAADTIWLQFKAINTNEAVVTRATLEGSYESD